MAIHPGKSVKVKGNRGCLWCCLKNCFSLTPKKTPRNTSTGSFTEVIPTYTMTSTTQGTASDEPREAKECEVVDRRTKLRKWLNMNFRIEMTDGRVLIGVFLCTDRDANVILGACSEYLKTTDGEAEEPRVLGLVMVPGRHIVSIQIDDTTPPQKYYYDD